MAAAMSLTRMMVNDRFTTRNFLRVHFNNFNIDQRPFTFMMRLTRRRFNTQLVHNTTIIRMLRRRISITRFKRIMRRLHRTSPKHQMTQNSIFRRHLHNFLINLTRHYVARGPDSTISALNKGDTTQVNYLRLLSRLNNLLELNLFLVGHNRLSMTSINNIGHNFTSNFSFIRILIMDTLHAMRRRLNRTHFQFTFNTPITSLLLYVSIQRTIQMLRMRRNRQSRHITFTVNQNFFRRNFNFILFNFNQAQLNRRRTARANLDTQQGIDHNTMDHLNLLRLHQIATISLSVNRTSLNFTMARIYRLLVVLLHRHNITTLRNFIHRTLIKRTSTATRTSHGNRYTGHVALKQTDILTLLTTQYVERATLVPSRTDSLPRKLQYARSV